LIIRTENNGLIGGGTVGDYNAGTGATVNSVLI
jgi:hypothetical protein